MIHNCRPIGIVTPYYNEEENVEEAYRRVKEVFAAFFFSAVQLFFTGILGECIGAIHTRVLKRPLVTEQERINFDD